MADARGAPAGGIRSLVDLLTEDGEALDADLQAHYGISLNDVAAGRVTLRRLRGLIAQLPPDGTALWRKSRRESKGKGKGVDPPADWWTPERDLMATLIDQQAILIWMNTEDARKGRNRPKPIKRPGVDQGRVMGKTSLPPAEAMAILARIGVQPSPPLT